MKELPAFKDIRPMSVEKATAAAGDDQLLRAMLQTFGADGPRIRQAVAVTRLEADDRIYGPELEKIEQEGASMSAKVANINDSLSKIKEKDARREKASQPLTSKSVAEWKREVSSLSDKTR